MLPGSPLRVPIAGRSGLPSSGLSGVVVNLTATAGTDAVALGVAPTTPAAPATPVPALLSVPAGSTTSTLVTVSLGSLGSLDLTATGGSVTVVADIVGFYAADDTVVASQGVTGGYQPLDPQRLLDATGSSAVAAGGRSDLGVDLGSTATPHATALLVRVTAQDATQAGTLVASTVTTADAGRAATPTTVSFAPGRPSSNLAVIPAELDADGLLDVSIANMSTAAVGVVVDLLGFYDDGTMGANLRFRPLPQTTVVDTGAGVGLPSLAPGKSQTLAPEEGVVGDSTFGLVGVVTTTAAMAGTLRLDDGDAVPTEAGALAVPVGASSSAVQTEVGTARSVTVRAAPIAAPIAAPTPATSGGANPTAPTATPTTTAGTSTTGTSTTGLVFEVTGSFEAYPPVVNAWGRTWVPPVSAWQISATPR